MGEGNNGVSSGTLAAFPLHPEATFKITIAFWGTSETLTPQGLCQAWKPVTCLAFQTPAKRQPSKNSRTPAPPSEAQQVQKGLQEMKLQPSATKQLPRACQAKPTTHRWQVRSQQARGRQGTWHCRLPCHIDRCTRQFNPEARCPLPRCASIISPHPLPHREPNANKPWKGQQSSCATHSRPSAPVQTGSRTLTVSWQDTDLQAPCPSGPASAL